MFFVLYASVLTFFCCILCTQAHTALTTLLATYQQQLGPGRTFEIDLAGAKGELLKQINEFVEFAAITRGEHQLAFILDKARENNKPASSDKVLRYAAALSKEISKPYDQAIHPDLCVVVKQAIEVPSGVDAKGKKGEKEKKGDKEKTDAKASSAKAKKK